MQPGVPTNPGIDDEDRAQRHRVYIQLGDPNVIVFGDNVLFIEIRKILLKSM